MSLLKKKKPMAEGGDVFSGKQRGDNEKGVHRGVPDRENAGTDKSYSKSMAGHAVRTAHEKFNSKQGPQKAEDADQALRANSFAKKEHKNTLKELRAMPNPKLMSKGGMADCPTCCNGGPCDMHDGDMVSDVMGKRKMAKGGEVESLADFDPNEFDELELNPPPMDHSSAGNEHGDSTLFEDAVSKVMLSRKKQSNPRPA